MPDTIMIKSIPNIHKKPKRKQQFLPIMTYTVSMDFEQNNDFKTGKSIQNIITIHLHTVNYHQMETHRMEKNAFLRNFYNYQMAYLLYKPPPP